MIADSAAVAGPKTDVRALETLLVERAVRGDELAFREIFETYRDRVHRVAFRVVKNHDDATDVAQDVWISLHKNIAGFRQDSSLGSWLHRVTVNAGLMHLRRHKRHTGLVELRESNSPRHDDMFARIEMREFLNAVERAWDDLAPIHREVLELRVTQDRSLPEIAEQLQISVPAAKTRVHRARRELAGLAET